MDIGFLRKKKLKLSIPRSIRINKPNVYITSQPSNVQKSTEHLLVWCMCGFGIIIIFSYISRPDFVICHTPVPDAHRVFV